MKKIYITGCAKTGTTLLRRLFNAFDINVWNKNEIEIVNFLKNDYVVGKRTANTVFSNILTNETIKRQLDLLNNVYIVNVIRNENDVLRSDNNYVSKKRYDACINQAIKYSDHIDFTVKYEELIADPNKIQQKLKSKFNLNINHNFDEYPNFVDVKQEDIYYHKGLYRLRKIGEKK